MIRAIEVRDLVVIERAELRPTRGLTAVTGETGAGKTVLAHALELLAGGAVDKDAVRPGAGHALVQATIGLPEGFWDDLPADDPARELRELVEDETEVVIARRVPAEGRARALVDGQVAATAGVASLARAAMRFSGQHEHRRLVSPSAQLALLDAFAGPDVVELARRLRRARRELAAIDRRLQEGRERREGAARERDRLAATVEQIEGAALDPDEKERLLVERDRLRNAERLAGGASGAAEALSPEGGEGGVLDAVGGAARELAVLGELDPELGSAARELEGAEATLQEVVLALRTYLTDLEAQPGRLDEVERRLGEYAELERRYGPDLAAVLDTARTAREALQELERGEADDVALRRERDSARAAAAEIAERLGEARASAAPELERRVGEELGELAMEGASVRIALESDGAEPPSLACTMWLRANAGLPEAPLAESASGGELSRVLLALHGIAAGAGQGAWIFDEVDAGIGGVTASAVARRLQRLAESRQVIVITHLPQVAALADGHYRLVKEGGADEGIATTHIEPLVGDDLVAELCRMLGASPDDEGARRHAGELLERRAVR
jgi:DNA repair protein RecN (Recombination protein N)